MASKVLLATGFKWRDVLNVSFDLSPLSFPFRSGGRVIRHILSMFRISSPRDRWLSGLAFVLVLAICFQNILHLPLAVLNSSRLFQ